MPELSEVAIFARDAQEHIKNNTILSSYKIPSQDKWAKTIVPQEVREYFDKSINSPFQWCSFGKSLVFLNPGSSHNVVFKLGMTGRLQKELPKELERHCFLTLELGTQKVHYVDFRRFGRISLIEKCPEKALGGFDGKNFWIEKELGTLVKRLPSFQKTPRISWLLKTGVETGVGNYLANEALGALSLNPFESFANENEVLGCLAAIAQIAQKSFELGGNSFAGGYVRFDGSFGDFFKECRFYKNSSLKRTVFKGRPVFSYYSL